MEIGHEIQLRVQQLLPPIVNSGKQHPSAFLPYEELYNACTKEWITRASFPRKFPIGT
jgi:hypothetical protein